MSLPNVICHADGSSSVRKRWYAKASLAADGQYTASAPMQVGELPALLDEFSARSKDLKI
jgi:hypothetical protein